MPYLLCCPLIFVLYIQLSQAFCVLFIVAQFSARVFHLQVLRTGLFFYFSMPESVLQRGESAGCAAFPHSSGIFKHKAVGPGGRAFSLFSTFLPPSFRLPTSFSIEACFPDL
jgi:hypothetical protein